MSATFEIFEDKSGQYRWRLVHANGNIIADSGEGYATKQKAKQGIESVQENAPDAGVVEVDG
ncbi:MAG: HVO_2922 family protein [Halobellus sp.]|uniref:HVO_2922 family protein n=1 Tax=Halobellus sp. TaxID=1979212 RepID=UPI0035D445A6